jgi:transposase
MKKRLPQAFTAEFKALALLRVKDGQTLPAIGRELGISHQLVRNRVKAAAAGKLGGAGSRSIKQRHRCLMDKIQLC